MTPTPPGSPDDAAAPDDRDGGGTGSSEEDALFGAVTPPPAPPPPGLRIPPLTASEEAAAAMPGDLAIDEERSLTRYATPEELAGAAAQFEHDRDQRFRDAFELIAIASLHLAYMAIGTLALVWALHLILPKDLRWLAPEEVTHLQTFLTAGVLVGVIGNHFKRRLGENDRNRRD